MSKVLANTCYIHFHTMLINLGLKSGLSLIQNRSVKIIHMWDKFIRNVKSRIYSLPMHVHKRKLYLLEQHSESLTIWSAIIKINTEGKSLVLDHGECNLNTS